MASQFRATSGWRQLDRENGSSAFSAIHSAVGSGLDLLFPPSCLGCGASIAGSAALCGGCWRETPFLAEPLCDQCGAPFDHEPMATAPPDRIVCERCERRPPPWRRGRAAILYDGAGRDLVLALKHADRTDIARPMARWMARVGAPLLESADALVPVPLHWRRRLRRRYNQSAEIARVLSRLSGAPLDLSALTRRRPTTSQDGKTAVERRRNVSDAFHVTRRGAARLADRRVLLIDDVLTTGATAGACARALLEAGAGAIDLLVFANVEKASRDPI